VVKPLESVVLGGQILEAESDSDSGVPFFKDIPILGHAFKSTSTSRKSVERLFIISPRVINQASETLTRTEMPSMGQGVRAPGGLVTGSNAAKPAYSTPSSAAPLAPKETKAIVDQPFEKFGSGR
ncbi:MAG: hypothetical protein ACRDAM_00990, partial [Casimicrobium sp.]